jgi:aminoglycoside phosphotransferase (APT) family kinase protein
MAESKNNPDGFNDIRRAVRRRFGANASIDNMSVATLGGSNRTVIFDLVEGASRRRLVSRQETYAGEEQMFLTPAQQFRLMSVVHKYGFPVPEPMFEYDAADAMGHGFVIGYVAGETMPKAIIHSEKFAALRPRLAARCGELLANLHAIDPREFDFLKDRPDSRDVVRAFLARYDHYGEAHPALEFGFRWLERNRAPDAPKRFVHGDFRCGNLMVDPEDVKAVLDWECSHLGDPMEDLAWICVRSWRFDRTDLPVGGFGERKDLYGAYERASGRKVDPDAVRYWEIFGLVRWAIYNIMQAYGHVKGGRRSVAFAACGRNTCLVEYDLLMTMAGHYT